MDEPASCSRIRRARLHVLRRPRVGPRESCGTATDRAAFEERFDRHFPVLLRLFHDLYGARPDWLDQLTELVMQSARSWAERPAELKALDADREHHSGWFQANTMLGGVCYVDRYAEDLAGVRARIPYFKELGLTYLHLMPLFLAPEPHSDGGYAVSSYRDVNPRLGTMRQLRDLAAELRANGISLVVDFIFNHTSDEHEWARKAAAGDPAFSDYYWIYPGPVHAGRVRANRARNLPGRPPRLVCRIAGRPVGLDHVPHVPVGPELRQPGRLPGHGRAKCCSWPTRAWTFSGWTPSPSFGSSSARRARTCPKPTRCCRRSTPCAGWRRRRCCSNPRRSSTPTRWPATSTPPSASSPTTPCRWP